MSNTPSESRVPLDRETLQKILDNSFDEIFVTDGKGIVIYVSKSCEENYGLKVDEMLGKPASVLGEKGYWFPPAIPVVVEKGQTINVEQYTSVGKKLLVTASPVFDDQGNIELIIANTRDITQLNEIKKDLDSASRLVKRYKKEVEALRKKQLDTMGMVAHSPEMMRILELCQHIATVESNLLILGESGTGKGVLARYIHKLSSHRENPFITINCAAIPNELLESEFFGYERGAFTGADPNGKIGLVELANEGTLFLDEIAELPMRLQAKLLDVIQEHRFIRVGGRTMRKVDIRIIAATNRNLRNMAAEGRFREDLYYRLNVVEIEIPPLRKRSDDIMPLIYLYLHRFDARYKSRHQISREALDLMLEYHWPGNIRELEHLMERLVVTVRNEKITAEDLPKPMCISVTQTNRQFFDQLLPLDKAVATVSRQLVIRAYKRLGSSYKVAEALKISQSKASRLIRKYVTEAGATTD